MSVYTNRRTIEFLYKVQDVGTRGLDTLVPGGVLDAFGPVGKGFSLPPDVSHARVLAHGVGLATLHPLVAFTCERSAKVMVTLSARNQKLVMSAESLTAMGTTVHIVTDEVGTSDGAKVEQLIRAIHERFA